MLFRQEIQRKCNTNLLKRVMDIQKYNYKKEVEKKSQLMESSVLEIKLERLSKKDGALEIQAQSWT